MHACAQKVKVPHVINAWGMVILHDTAHHLSHDISISNTLLIVNKSESNYGILNPLHTLQIILDYFAHTPTYILYLKYIKLMIILSASI